METKEYAADVSALPLLPVVYCRHRIALQLLEGPCRPFFKVDTDVELIKRLMTEFIGYLEVCERTLTQQFRHSTNYMYLRDRSRVSFPGFQQDPKFITATLLEQLRLANHAQHQAFGLIPTCKEAFEGPHIDVDAPSAPFSLRLIADFFVQSFTEVATHLFLVDGTPISWTKEDLLKVFEMSPQHKETIGKGNGWYSLQSELLGTFQIEQSRNWALSGVNPMKLQEQDMDNH